MDKDELAAYVVALAASVDNLSDDLAARVQAMDLEPTLRDRTLLLIEQTRLLAERSSNESGGSDRLRAIASEQTDRSESHHEPDTAARSDRLAEREATADARDDLLQQREDTATARDETLDQRESVMGARERRLDDRERAADLTDDSLRLREQAVNARSEAMALHAANSDEFGLPSLESLTAAVERAWRAAQGTDEGTDADRSEVAAVEAVVAEVQRVVPEFVERTMHRWVQHAHHELRQPLAVITGVAETLSEHHRRLDQATLDTLMARLLRQSAVMQQVINQMELATRVRTDSPEVSTQRIDLRSVVEQFRDDQGSIPGGAETTYERPNGPVLACVEPLAVAQILGVLLRNAVDHAPCEEPILIETVSGSRTARISIHDDGAGVPAAAAEHIFAYGTRLNSAGILGLGLFIARGLARTQGGDLVVGDSERLGGARFDLTIPTGCGGRTDTPP